jgi:hypothetical protein
VNIVECKKGRYFVGAWYLYDATHPHLQKQDWFATVFREEGESVWHLRYRHKYYNSPDPFDPKDRRSSYSGTLSGMSEQQIIETMEQMTTKLCEVGGFKRDFIYFGTDDGEAVIERMKARPYLHAQIIERPKPQSSK